MNTIGWVIGGYLLYAATLWYATWVFYCAGMAFAWAGERIQGETARLAKATTAVAFALNVALNWTVMTLLFLELPREPNVSARCSRHFRSGSGWRKRLAAWFGRVWLDPLDPHGFHI
jgi:hypothetical protein